MDQNIHKPVLKKQVIDLLSPQKGDKYLDLTAGYGGHASLVAEKLGKEGRVTLVDRDVKAVDFLRQQFGRDDRVKIIHSDFYSASLKLFKNSERFDLILADIGLSSPHLDNSNRGFSYLQSGPLDMRMDQTHGITAAEYINDVSQSELTEILYRFGEINNSRRISEIIIKNRPYSLTDELAKVIPGTHKTRIKLLSKVFQAIRIKINDELEQLNQSLPLWHKMLKENGKLAVITFHSLEDRIVKQYFAESKAEEYQSGLCALLKKPITADWDEVVYNPRSRSAKLRVVQRK